MSAAGGPDRSPDLDVPDLTDPDAEVVDAEIVDGDLGGTADDQVTDDGGYPDITSDDPIDGDLIDGDLVEAVQVAEAIAAERDEYLDMARRVQADFENYKRRVEAQQVEQRQRAAEGLARELLPVLDAGEAAIGQGMDDVAPLYTQLLATLEKQGLTKVDAADVEFDPNVHEAVMHEEGSGGEAVVVEVMRTGYLWNSRVLRPAMVKVRS